MNISSVDFAVLPISRAAHRSQSLCRGHGPDDGAALRASKRPHYPEDLIAIVSFAVKLGIPSFDLHYNDGVRLANNQLPEDKPQSLAYLLGSGATCVVTKHETGSETSEVVPSGTIVALKRYLRKRGASSSDERYQEKRLYRLVWQDLAVYSHPYLKTHENISKLRFLYWEPQILIPAFALELAEYGTLDHFVSDNHDLLDDKLRTNLSADVVTGLAALHACDFVHGDIKPGNVVLHRDSRRKVLARLSDFAGAGTVGDFGKGQHLGFGTTDWLAPEILLSKASFDWQKADVFSVGLLLVHLWWPSEAAGGFFLDSLCPSGAEGDERNNFILRVKLSQPTKGDHHVVALLETARTQNPRDDGKEEDHTYKDTLLSSPLPGLLKDSLNGALRTDGTTRLSASSLVTMLEKAEVTENNPTPENRHFEPAPELVPAILAIPKRESVIGQSLVPDKRYLQRSYRFQETVVSHLANSIGVGLNGPTVWPTSSMISIDEADYDNYVEVIKWHEATNESATFKEKDIGLYMKAYELGLSYLLGLGVECSESLALDALSYAAQGCISWAMAMFPSIQASCHPSSRDRSADYESVWLSYGMRNGCHETFDRARLVAPRLYQTTREIKMSWKIFHGVAIATSVLRERQPSRMFLGIMVIAQIQLMRSSFNPDDAPSGLMDIFAPGIRFLHAAAGLSQLSSLQWLILEAKADVKIQDAEGRPPIWYAIEAGDLDTVQFLLTHGADANFTDATSASLLHKASFHEDSIASKIARILLDHGAKLETMASEVPNAGQSPFVQNVGWPILWAITRNRPRLFSVLLRAHYENNATVETPLWFLMLSRIAIYTQCAILKDILNFGDSCTASPNPVALVKKWFSSVPSLAIREPTYHTIECRWLLGAEYYSQQAKFLRMLLGLGVDPLPTGRFHDSALYCAFKCGDRQAVEIFFEHLEARGVDVLELLTKGCEGYGAGMWLLLVANCSDALVYVLNRFPSLVQLEEIGVPSGGYDLRRDRHPGALVNTPGRLGRALHFAAKKGPISAVRAVVDAGADIYDCDNLLDATAFELALDQGRVNIAETMIRHADKKRLIGGPSAVGNTLFGRLIYRAHEIRRRQPLEVFQFLNQHGGLDFITNVRGGWSFWALVFPRNFVSRQALIEEDLRLLDFFLQPDVLLHTLHMPDGSGMAAIHYACRYGNYQSVKMLLQNGANIYQEKVEATAGLNQTLQATKPFQMFSVTERNGPPASVLSGGKEEERLWHADRKALRDLLVEHGADRDTEMMLQNDAFARVFLSDEGRLRSPGQNFVRFLQRGGELTEKESPENDAELAFVEDAWNKLIDKIVTPVLEN